ncbi:MAG: GNAT family N-acyltransferase [Pseudomonadota bacterium]
MLDVREILQERYPRFFREHQRTANTLSHFLRLLFCEKRFKQFERDYPHLKDFDFVEAVLRYFDFGLRLQERERARIPDSGRVVIVANHPIGSLDGLALLDLVREVRPDVRVVADEVLAEIKPLQSLLLPVHNMGGVTPRDNLRNIRRHLDMEGALIIFPAGEVSRLGPKGIKDGAWQSGFVKIARAAKAPILPIYVAGRNSMLFYSISFLARPLSTLWLVREMFKQSHSVVDARVGNPVPHHIYEGVGASPKRLAALFRKHVYRLARDGRPIFQTEETVAHPENRLLLKRELESAELLGETPDGKQIYLYQQREADCVMREIGRLRELTFRSVGEGTGMPRDIDRHDRDYLQLLLWDRENLEIAGAYRLGCTAELLKRQGWSGMYTHSLFHFGDAVKPTLEQGLELGRSFVQPRYQDRKSLDYLWWGIGAFIQRYPQYRYLFGPVSISRFYGEEDIARLVYFYSRHYGRPDLGIEAVRPFVAKSEYIAKFDERYGHLGREDGFKLMRHDLTERGLSVPPLYKHYMEAANPAGVFIGGFNVDADFSDCVDGFVLVDLAQLKPRKQKRYLGKEDFFSGSVVTKGEGKVQDAVDFRRTPGQRAL